MMFESPSIPSSSGIDIIASSSRRRMNDQGIRWYYKLESSASSVPSEEETESIYSFQGYETEYIVDTPDTDTKSEYSSSDNDHFEVEYEVESEVEIDPPNKDSSSSGDDQEVIAVATASAITLFEESLTSWATEVEDSDSSQSDTEMPEQFLICVQCNLRNTNPRFRLCLKCFQARKNLYEPPPKGHRKRKTKKKEFQVALRQSVRTTSASKENEAQPSSQDSAYASQEFSCGSQEIQRVNTGSQELSSGSQEVQKVTTGNLQFSSGSQEIEKVNTGGQLISIFSAAISRGVKRKSGECDEDFTKRLRTEEVEKPAEFTFTNSNLGAGLSRVSKRKSNEHEDDSSKRLRAEDNTKESIDLKIEKEEFLKPATPSVKYPLYDDNKMCIICENEKQTGLFLHSGMGCLCCCYRCAKRTWKQNTKCPACTRKVKSVIRINRA